MAQPPRYDRQFNFQNQQSLTPSAPLPADELDSELNQIKITLDAILGNLGLLQRDDGELANETVGVDQLKPELAWVGEDITEIEAARDAAVAAAAAAAASETDAENAELAAEASAAAAAAAKTDAENARDAAAASAAAAAASESAAALSAAAALVSETLAESAQVAAENAQIAAEAAAERLAGTSSSSNSIGVGVKSFVTEPSKFFDPGMFVLITSDASPAVDYMHGVVTSYSGSALTVLVTDTGGSGTHADWTIRVSGTNAATQVLLLPEPRVITGATATIADTDLVAIVSRDGPTTTALTLGPVADRNGYFLTFKDLSINVADPAGHTITFTPDGSETIDGAASFEVFSNSESKGSCILVPSVNLDGWYSI